MPSPLKKIQDLVYKGMVLDEKGAWIPLAEKLRKEKKFLNHLEQGEVLVDGVWCKLSDIPNLTTALDETRDVRHHAATPPPAPEAPEIMSMAHRTTPEETVSFSTDTLRDVALPRQAPEPSPPEDDFAPETKIFSIIRTQDTPLLPPADRTILPPDATNQLVTGETQAYLIPGRQLSPPSAQRVTAAPATEFQETVLYNTKMLKKTEASPSAAQSPALIFPKVSAAPRNLHSDEDEHLLRKPTLPFWLIMLVGVAGIAAVAVVWLLL